MNRRQAAAQRKRDAKVISDLAALLTKYMQMHYGNPATGKMSAVLDGPVIARLSAAAALLALLQVKS